MRVRSFLKLSARSVASALPGIGEGFSRFRDKLPGIASRKQGQLQNAKSFGIADFTVGILSSKRPMILSAGASNKFANTARRIRLSVGSLRSEALVVVIVTADDDIGVGGVERIPERPDGEIVAVFPAGTEQGFMKIGQRASDRMGGKIFAEPFALRRGGVAASSFDTFAVEDNDVPSTKFVAVVALVGFAGSGAKILEIVGGAGGVKFMIAGGGASAVFDAAPSLVVASEIFGVAIGIGQIANGHDCAGNFFQEFGGGFRTGKIGAVGNVAGPDQHRGVFWRSRERSGVDQAQRDNRNDHANKI